MKETDFISKIMSTPNDLEDQIEATRLQLKISAFSIEKDWYVTKIIYALSGIKNDYYQLVFQGGTCLAKAYHLVPRMSEDCDFRIMEKIEVKELSREKKRKELRTFRQTIFERIKQAGFDLDDDGVHVRDEGRFINLKGSYHSLYPATKSLKPHLAVDFFVSDVKDKTESRSVTTLIQKTLGKKVSHQSAEVACVSIPETAAEKWIGLTRRIATIEHREHYYDAALVRHIYDLDKIKKADLINDDFYKNVRELIGTEREKFKTHNMNYYHDPEKEIRRALTQLSEQKWQNNWQDFIEAMVFELNPASYEEALNNLHEISKKCLAEMKMDAVPIVTGNEETK